MTLVQNYFVKLLVPWRGLKGPNDGTNRAVLRGLLVLMLLAAGLTNGGLENVILVCSQTALKVFNALLLN